MAKPRYRYVCVHIDLATHPKLATLTPTLKLAVVGSLVFAWSHCKRHQTDGYVDAQTWATIGTARTRRAMIDTGFAEPVPGGVNMHDYQQWQETNAERDAITEARRAAGAAGLLAQGKRSPFASPNRDASASPPTMQLHPLDKTGQDISIDPSSSTGTVDAAAASNGERRDRPEVDPQNLAGVVAAAVLTATGRQIAPAAAAELARELVGGRQLDHPAAYLRKIIANEPNPLRRFVERSGPAVVGTRAGDRPPPARQLCRRCGGNHPAGECPTGPRRPTAAPDADIAKRGAAAARQALADAKAANDAKPPQTEPPAPDTGPERAKNDGDTPDDMPFLAKPWLNRD